MCVTFLNRATPTKCPSLSSKQSKYVFIISNRNTYTSSITKSVRWRCFCNGVSRSGWRLEIFKKGWLVTFDVFLWAGATQPRPSPWEISCKRLIVCTLLVGTLADRVQMSQIYLMPVMSSNTTLLLTFSGDMAVGESHGAIFHAALWIRCEILGNVIIFSFILQTHSFDRFRIIFRYEIIKRAIFWGVLLRTWGCRTCVDRSKNVRRKAVFLTATF